MGRENSPSSVVREVFESVFNEDLFDRLPALYAPRFKATDSSNGIAEEASPETVARLMKMYRSAMPDLRYQVDQVIADGGDVAVRWTAKGTHAGVFLGVPPTQQEIVVSGASFVRVEEGRIVQTWQLFDLASLRDQLGGPGGARPIEVLQQD